MSGLFTVASLTKAWASAVLEGLRQVLATCMNGHVLVVEVDIEAGLSGAGARCMLICPGSTYL